MIENLFAPENALFLVALGLFLLIFLVQLISLLFGMEPFSFMDSLLPDVDFDADLDIGDASPGFVDSVMSMLRLGRVPFVFTFILFLFLFSQIGYIGQQILYNLGIGRIHWLVASLGSFLLTLPMLRAGNSVLEKVLPKDETAAISSETFIGRMATVVLGTVTSSRSAEAKVIGPDGKVHYIQVIADNEGKVFHKGDHLLVVARRGEGLFSVIENKNPLLEEY